MNGHQSYYSTTLEKQPCESSMREKLFSVLIHFYDMHWLLFLITAGCGNGKYLHINEDIFKLGCDVCQPLVDSAWSRGHEVQLCDGLRLPYRDGCFDAVLSIAGNAAK